MEAFLRYINYFLFCPCHHLGYETTNNALAYTTYLLATHPSEQDKLCQEIDEYFNEHQVSLGGRRERYQI